MTEPVPEPGLDDEPVPDDPDDTTGWWVDDENAWIDADPTDEIDAAAADADLPRFPHVEVVSPDESVDGYGFLLMVSAREALADMEEIDPDDLEQFDAEVSDETVDDLHLPVIVGRWVTVI